MKKLLFTIMLLLMHSNLRAQVTATGSLAERVSTFLSGIPTVVGGNQYADPSPANLTAWGSCLSSLLSGNYATAHTTASGFGYQVVQFSDTTTSPSKVYYVLEKTSGSSNHWGMFIYNPAASRPKVFIQSPHPIKDLNTGNQGFTIYKRLGAIAFWVAGASRCNSDVEVACDGTTDVCGVTAAYTISDQAHNVSSTLQKATDVFKTSISNLIIVQNHGFSKESGDPDLIMSNGKTTAPTGTDYLALVKTNLSKLNSSLQFKIIHIDTDFTKLTGTTNVQARLLNGSGDPCGTNAATANGRFLHIEQAYSGLRDNETSWARFANALAMSLPITPSATGNWSNTATWPGSVTPDSMDYVQVAAAQTITVDTDARCNSVAFAASTAKLALATGATLNVYGDFTLFSDTHAAFSSWASGAKLAFKGAYKQTLSGWSVSSSTTTNTSLMEVVVNKTGDTLKTPGSDMKLTLGTSFEVVNGIAFIDTADDINGKTFSGAAGASPTITVQSGGTFYMHDGFSHTRSGGSGSGAIGKITVYGTAALASSSSLGINYSGIDVESGGTLRLYSFSNSQPNNFNPGTVTVKSGGTLEVSSQVNFWNASAAVTLQSGGTYKVAGATTNFPVTFTNSGTVEYSANLDQTLYGRSYSSLSVTGTGNKTLNADASVSGTFTLAGGNVVTGANTLTLGTATSNIGTLSRSTGYIVGNFKRWFSASVTVFRTFAIGTSSAYLPASISFTSAPSVGGTVKASFTNATPGTAGLPLNDAGTQILSVAPEGYWTLTAADGLTGGVYSMNLTPTGFANISDMTTLRIIKRSTGGNWTLDGTHEAGTTVVKRTGMSGFSEFGIGGAADNPLPVELSAFTAAAKGKAIILRWQTQTEVNSASFTVQRSGENDFLGSVTDISVVRAAGNSNAPREYTVQDPRPLNASNYYRLKITDADGSFAYSAIINAVAALPQSFGISAAYPNPFNPETAVVAELPEAGWLTADLWTVDGTKVRTVINGNALAGRHTLAVSAAGLPSGIYVLTVRYNGIQLARKLMVTK